MLQQCSRCNSDVIETEKICLPSGRVFHGLCFQCSNPSCHRYLDNDSYAEIDEKIYCKECATGSTEDVYQNGRLHVVYNNRECEKWRATVSDVPQVFKRSGTFNGPAGFSVRKYDDDYRTTILPKGGSEYSCSLSLFSQSAASLPEPYIGSSASLRNRPTWTMKSHANISDSSNNAVSLSKSSTCQRCSKVVFQAEKVVAASSVWHKTCFRCRECGRSLEPGKFCDRDSEIFCSKCYAKNFGPKGVGCGIGAGILQMHQ